MDNKQFSVNILHKPTKPNGNEWRFYEFGIACVFPTPTEPTDNADPINIAPLIQGVIDYELTNKDGFFCKSYSPQKEDESLDELLCVDAYGMKCSFQPFLSELKTFGVTDLFGQDLIKCIFQVLNEIGRFIKDNTDKPQAIKNHIISMLDVFGNIQIVSAMARITVMRGLEMFYMECLDTIEGYGSAEVEDILMWVALEEGKMISAFTILPLGLGVLSKEVAEHIKPFTDYLYSTEIGKMANDTTLSSLYGCDISNEEAAQDELPEEFTNPNTKEVFQKAIDAPQEANAKPKKRGRKVGNFRDNLMVDEKEKDAVIEKLRLLISGRKGRCVALIIHSCVKLGWLIKPSFSQVKNTFGRIGDKSGYNFYVNNPSQFADQEVNGMIERLKAL